MHLTSKPRHSSTGQGGRGVVEAELGVEFGALGTVADHAAVGPEPGQEAQGVDDQRLAGAGLARDHGHARAELQFGGRDDGEVAEGQAPEHGPLV